MDNSTTILRRRARNQSSAWLRSVIPPLRRDARVKGNPLTFARVIAIVRAELARRGDKES